MQSCTIGIDARTFYYPNSISRGIGHYSKYHLAALAKERPEWRFICYVELLDIPDSLQMLKQLPNIEFRLVDTFDAHEIDIMHICDPMSMHVCFDSPLRIFRGPHHTTVTFYDLTPLRLYFSKWNDTQRTHYRLRLQQCINSKSVFLTISDFTAADLIKETGLSTSRVHSIMAGLNLPETPSHQAGDQTEAVLNRLGIRRPFFLHVGALDIHKNFDASATAFLALCKSEDARLVVVGAKNSTLEQYAVSFGARGEKRIIFTDFISRDDLDTLYQEATALLFMSRYEGFGFPVLEAMAHGCPVITSNVTSIPEVAGDAAIMLAPDDINGVSSAMIELLNHPERADALRQKGIQQAARFTWQNTAQKTIEVWENMRGSSKHVPDYGTAVDAGARQRSRNEIIQATVDTGKTVISRKDSKKKTREMSPTCPLNAMTNPKARIILFGTGASGMCGYQNLKSHYHIIGFCDNDAAKQKLSLFGLPVYSPITLPDLDFDFIVICSMYHEHIHAQLTFELNIPLEKVTSVESIDLKMADSTHGMQAMPKA